MASERSKRIALLGVGTLCGLLAFELAVRLIEPREVLREYFVRPDSILHHKFAPGTHGWHKTLEFDASYVINSVGLRSGEISREKPQGTRRILMLGDSFTEGNGVQQLETFSSRLQEELDQGGLGRWHVINAGVGSYSPLLEYLYLKNGGLELQPDLVVLSLDLSDVYDDIQYTRLAEFDEKGDPVAVRAEASPEKTWPTKALVAVKDYLKEHTRTYNFVRRRVSRLIEAATRDIDLSGDVRSDKYAMLRREDAPSHTRDWELSYGYLRRIRDLLRSKGIEFWVTLYPYGLQVSPREWRSGRLYWGFQAGRVYSTWPQRVLESFCRNEGIPVVNMCGDFEELSRTVYPLYYEYDGHWTPRGHQLVADVLYRELGSHLRTWESGPASARANP